MPKEQQQFDRSGDVSTSPDYAVVYRENDLSRPCWSIKLVGYPAKRAGRSQCAHLPLCILQCQLLRTPHEHPRLRLAPQAGVEEEDAFQLGEWVRHRYRRPFRRGRHYSRRGKNARSRAWVFVNKSGVNNPTRCVWFPFRRFCVAGRGYSPSLQVRHTSY